MFPGIVSYPQLWLPDKRNESILLHVFTQEVCPDFLFNERNDFGCVPNIGIYFINVPDNDCSSSDDRIWDLFDFDYVGWCR